MPVFSHLHQRFEVNTCYASLHTLRWTDRLLQCPRCQSQDVDPWGHYHDRPGIKRDWCHGCRRTFNDLTHTLFAQSKRSFVHGILATFLFGPLVLVSSYGQGVGCPCPPQLSLVLVVTQRCSVL